MTGSPQPLTTREILDLLGRDTTEPVTVSLLTGGYRNLIHRAEGAGFDVVIKQYAQPDENPLFPLLFDDEWRLLSDCEDAGIAPHLVAIDRPRQLLVYEFVPGEVWNGGATGMATLLSRVGTVAPFEWLRRLPASVDELRTHTSSILAGLTKPPLGLLKHFEVADQPFEARLVHTDCGPGNVIGAAGRYRLIDWQCPGRGDPVEDLAAFSSPGVQILYGRAPLGNSEVEELLSAYGQKDVVERFRWKARLYWARFAAYCAWRIERLHDSPAAERYRLALTAELEALRS